MTFEWPHTFGIGEHFVAGNGKPDVHVNDGVVTIADGEGMALYRLGEYDEDRGSYEATLIIVVAEGG